ncbi:hypothetical protein [Pontibacter pamirensis]|uniref:hypothetical protein n=1 Tax=Pontibacter pamirensis TaxID=2562824 RepID=UPI001389A9CF|nr:hypothetical protein [Pontibacter pamirensis]
MLLYTLDYMVAVDEEYLTIHYNRDEKLMWNQWQGAIPSPQLREAMISACQFILANDVELILADFTRMCAPTVEDQVWIGKNSAELLQHSKLRKVANLMARDIFQQMAIDNIYDKASELPMPCESRTFVSKFDAMEWLMADGSD